MFEIIDNNYSHNEKNKDINTKDKRIKSTKIKYKINRVKVEFFPLTISEKNLNNNSFKKDNNINKCTFSNKELQKHINNKYDGYTLKKLNGTKNISMSKNNKNRKIRNKTLNNNDNIIVTHLSYSPNKNKRELREKSTNTDNINTSLNNNLYISNPITNSNGSFTEEKRKYIKNKRLIKTNYNSYFNLNKFFFQKLKQPNLEKKKNLTQTNLIMTDINKTPENSILNQNCPKEILDENHNYIKLYNELYNYYLVQSLIQNKSNFFNIKKNNLMPFNYNKSRNITSKNIEININNNLINESGLSIRELLRNINYDNYSINSSKNNKKNKLKKSLELTICKKTNIDECKKKINLKNLQYE